MIVEHDDDVLNALHLSGNPLQKLAEEVSVRFVDHVEFHQWPVLADSSNHCPRLFSVLLKMKVNGVHPRHPDL